MALPSDSVNCKKNCDSVTVTTRIFYNSKCQKENVKALFSRGNKRRLLTQGRQVITHAPHIHRTSCVPNNRDRGYGVTVSPLPPMLVMTMIPLTKLSTRSCQINPQVMVFPPKYTHGSPRLNLTLNWGHLAGGHMKEVSLAIDRCDIDSIHEPISTKNSVVGGNTITHENQKCDNT